MLHGVALALVVTSGVSLLGLLLCSVMKPFAQNHSTRSASGGRDGIAVGKLVTEIRAAGAERHIADGASRCAASEQADNESGEECSERDERECGFHKRELLTVSCLFSDRLFE